MRTVCKEGACAKAAFIPSQRRGMQARIRTTANADGQQAHAKRQHSPHRVGAGYRRGQEWRQMRADDKRMRKGMGGIKKTRSPYAATVRNVSADGCIFRTQKKSGI
jgi:hypothetical protein